MGKGRAPAPPDPTATAAAQTATNIGTAVANTAGGQVNQYGPEGSLEYEQRGTFEYTDPTTGAVHEIPQYSAITSLTPEAQSVYDESLGAQLGLARTANQQSEFLQDYLGQPADFDTEAIENRLSDLGRQRLDPRFQDEEDTLRTRLINQGLSPGTEAWEREMRSFGQYRNDAYNSLALQGRGQAFSEIGAARNQPINEISALLSGSQVSTPQFQIAQPAQAATTDVAGIINQDYANRFGVYNSRLQSRNTLLGGAFGALGAAGAAGIGAF